MTTPRQRRQQESDRLRDNSWGGVGVGMGSCADCGNPMSNSKNSRCTKCGGTTTQDMRNMSAQLWTNAQNAARYTALKTRFVWMWLSLLFVGCLSIAYLPHTLTPQYRTHNPMLVFLALAIQVILLIISGYRLDQSLRSQGKLRVRKQLRVLFERRVLKECLVNGFLAWVAFILLTVLAIFLKGPEFLLRETSFAVIWSILVFAVCPAIIFKRPFRC